MTQAIKQFLAAILVGAGEYAYGLFFVDTGMIFNVDVAGGYVVRTEFHI